MIGRQPNFTLFFFLFSSFLIAACTKSGGEPLKHVKSEEVCMVNDTHFGQVQIPVKVGSQTYYGCCENCKKTLGTDASSRFAIDPVSDAKVDKAKAIIGADTKKHVYYFESMANLQAFRVPNNN